MNTTSQQSVNASKIPTVRDVNVTEIKNQVYALLVAKSYKQIRSMAEVQADIVAMKGFEDEVYSFLEVAEVVPLEVDELLETIQEAITDLRFEKREIEFWIRKQSA